MVLKRMRINESVYSDDSEFESSSSSSSIDVSGEKQTISPVKPLNQAEKTE